MARTTFFSFHYRDVESFRVNVVRNSSLFKKPGDASKVIDGSLWEASQLRGEKALKELIDGALIGTSVTAVLIGANTHERKWVKYELVRSFVTGNAILGIHLNRIREAHTQRITAKGLNPLDRLAVFVPDDYKALSFLELVKGNSVYFSPSFLSQIGFGPTESERKILFSKLFNTYCWTNDDGYHNMANWIETARLRDTHTL
jgi:hypothetical protein